MFYIQTVPVSVRLYRTTAEIIRRGSIELEAGKTTLAILGLTPSANTETLRLFTDNGLQLLSLRVEEKETFSDGVLKLMKQINALKQQNEVREIQKKLWEANGDFTGRSSLSATEVTDYINRLPAELTKLYEETVACTEQIEQLEKKLEQAKVLESGPVAVADFDVTQAGSHTLELHYLEPDACWNPLYEIHTDGEGPLELRLRASMRQTTGEDWEAVQLTVVSGTTSGNHTLPVRSMEYADAVEKPKARFAGRMAGKMQANMMQMAGAVMEDAMPMMATAMMEAAAPMAEEESGTLMNEYGLGDGYTIRSNQSESLADLQRYSLSANYQIKTVPRQDNHAYLTAEIKTEELPFLYTNQAKVYLSGQQIGEVRLSSDDGEAVQTLSLGKEERIRIQVKERSRKQSKTLLSGQNVRELEYETIITNTLDHPVTIQIMDQIPVSAGNGVTVEPLNLSDYNLDKEHGYLEAEQTINAKESCSLKLGYKILWPKDKELKVVRSLEYPKYCPECGSPMAGPVCGSCGWSK